MRTLRAVRHMERVECVTDHVRESQSMVGGVLSDVAGEYLDGSLRAIVGLGSAIEADDLLMEGNVREL